MRDDRILPLTRVILGVVVLILLAAFFLLYLFPQSTADTFAWAIKPPLTAMIMGAGYVGGAYQFLYAIFGRKWHTVTNAFWPVTSFTIFMLLATLLHWDRFIHTHATFYIWLVVYFITPFLVPWLWLRNRIADPLTAEPGEVLVPRWLRSAFGLAGGLGLLLWIFGFIFPQPLINIWPWTVTPLTMRVLCGWGSLLGVGGLMLYFEPRWSSWRLGLQSIAIWQGLVVLAGILRPQDFKNGTELNFYFIADVLLIIAIIGLYAWFENKSAHAR